MHVTELFSGRLRKTYRSTVSSHHVSFWVPTQSTSLGSKQFHLMNHLVSPKICFRKDSCYLKEIIPMLYLSASCLYRGIIRTISLYRGTRFCAVCIGLSYRTKTQQTRLTHCVLKGTNLLVSAEQTHVDGFGDEWVNNYGVHVVLVSQQWLLRLNFWEVRCTGPLCCQCLRCCAYN
jgi:hypothetical protein